MYTDIHLSGRSKCKFDCTVNVSIINLINFILLHVCKVLELLYSIDVVNNTTFWFVDTFHT